MKHCEPQRGVPPEPQPRSTYHHGDLRHALLEAAEQELAEKGVEGFTLRGCAKRAGVSHAAPAHHFGDAAGLLTALAGVGFSRLVEAMRRRIDEARPVPYARLVAAGIGYVDFATSSPALFRLMFASFKPDFGHEALGGVATDAFMILVETVSDVIGEPAMESADGRLRIAGTWSIVHGFADLVMSDRLKFMVDGGREDCRPLLEAMLSSIAMPEPSSLA